MTSHVRYSLHFSTHKPTTVKAVHNRVSHFLPCFNLTRTQGAWEGVPEVSYRVEFIGTIQDESIILETAKYLKYVYQQDCVLVTKEPVHAIFV